MTPLTMTLDTTKLSRVKKGCNVAWITIIACLLVPWAALFAFHIVKNHSALCKNSVFLCSIWGSGNKGLSCMSTWGLSMWRKVAMWLEQQSLLACWCHEQQYSHSILWKIIQICAKTLFFFKSLIWGSGNKGLTWRRGLNNTQLY